jgi:TPR repeat protein
MTGFSGCQGTDAERSKYFPHYLSSNESGSGIESLFILSAVVIGGMAWAIESTGVHLQPSLTIEPKERVLSPLAFSQLSAAAKRGDALAQNNFGVCHFIGQGVAQDRQLAVYWYQLSADQGFAPAQANLARCYATGEGVWRDDVEAYAYASLAGLTQPGMAEFEAKLSPAQVTAGKQRRAELRGRIAAKLATKEAPDARK